MSDIDIRRAHSLPPADARAAIDEVAQSLAAKFGMRCDWQGNMLTFSRRGVDGSIAVDAQQIHLQARLGLTMRALRPLIEREIERYLDQRLG